MGHYKSNLRDLEFVLFEVFGLGDRLGSAPFSQLDVGTAKGALEEIDRLARGPVADTLLDGDRNPPTFDPEHHSAKLPESFKNAFRILIDGEWFRLDVPEHMGGYNAPPSLRWAISELLLGANPALFFYFGWSTLAGILDRIGNGDQKRIAQLMVDRHWGATMVLTEPDAGSDVGAGRTRAIAQPDGSWHIEGVKRFITGGDQDLTENIIHLVLARPENAGPGSKGLSLFVVPKFLFDLQTGELAERNGVFATNLEHKMGLKGSTTCELTFGEKQPAVGWLVGDVHDGIAQMFQVIEYARMLVGTKAIATLSTGYLNALDYAKSRIQGADMTQMTDKTAPRVTITHHPDVRRMLMMQKAYAEGMRALVLYAASFQDAIQLAESTGQRDELADRINDLLLPIVKGFGSERSYEFLALSLQTLGGSGYLQDYPIEQYLRDAKIDTLYEGTTSIQSLDLFFRKIIRDNGMALNAVMQEIQSFVDSDLHNGRLKQEKRLLSKAMSDMQGIVDAMQKQLMAARSNPESIYRVGQNTTRLLMSLGDVIIGWLLLRSAAVAMTALDHDPTEQDHAFYQGKIAVAKYFAATVLPELASRRWVAENIDNTLMDLPEESF